MQNRPLPLLCRAPLHFPGSGAYRAEEGSDRKLAAWAQQGHSEGTQLFWGTEVLWWRPA